MAEDATTPEQQLRDEFHSQTARIPWSELQPHYARGALIWVANDHNLVEVAVQLARNNTEQFEQWIAAGQVNGVSDDQARDWLAGAARLWAVVAPPYVLVQERRAED